MSRRRFIALRTCLIVIHDTLFATHDLCIQDTHMYFALKSQFSTNQA